MVCKIFFWLAFPDIPENFAAKKKKKEKKAVVKRYSKCDERWMKQIRVI